MMDLNVGDIFKRMDGRGLLFVVTGVTSKRVYLNYAEGDFDVGTEWYIIKEYFLKAYRKYEI